MTFDTHGVSAEVVSLGVANDLDDLLLILVGGLLFGSVSGEDAASLGLILRIAIEHGGRILLDVAQIAVCII